MLTRMVNRVVGYLKVIKESVSCQTKKRMIVPSSEKALMSVMKR